MSDVDKKIPVIARTINSLMEEIATLEKERTVDAILKNSADKLTGDLLEKIAEQEEEIAALKKENAQYVTACRQFEQTVERLEAELARARKALSNGVDLDWTEEQQQSALAD